MDKKLCDGGRDIAADGSCAGVRLNVVFCRSDSLGLDLPPEHQPAPRELQSPPGTVSHFSSLSLSFSTLKALIVRIVCPCRTCVLCLVQPVKLIPVVVVVVSFSIPHCRQVGCSSFRVHEFVDNGFFTVLPLGVL